MLIDFCLPVYNEEKILKNSVLKLLNYCEAQNFDFDWRIIVAVNGSSDNSFNIAEQISKEQSRVAVKEIKESGRGQALKKYFAQSSADIFVYMDIDLAVDLKNIPDLIQPILRDEYDIAVGSRLLSDSKIDRSFVRSLSSKMYNALSRKIFNCNFCDLQCGFKAIRAEAFRKIIPYIQDEKWFFDTEFLILANHFDFKIKEIPVDWKENRYDLRKSKVKLIRDTFLFIKNLLELKKRIKTI
jgi:glycosyltransferase involved in cell wall biosynthesis